MTKLIVAFRNVAKLPEKKKKDFFFFSSSMMTDFMKERIEQMLEVSCMVLIFITNINCKCRTY